MTRKVTKGRYLFVMSVTRIIDYDINNKECYGDVDFIEDMVTMDLESANDDPIMFFDTEDSNWSDVKVRKLVK